MRQRDGTGRFVKTAQSKTRKESNKIIVCNVDALEVFLENYPRKLNSDKTKGGSVSRNQKVSKNLLEKWRYEVDKCRHS